MRKIILLVVLLLPLVLMAQVTKYGMSQVHSHNDYEQVHPFYTAYNAGCGSIEADIFLDNGDLLVAHEVAEKNRSRTLESLYLDKIDSALQANKGFPYHDHTKPLQLLIDLKTDGMSLLNELVQHLKKYPRIINCPVITITITGDIPDPSYFHTCPDFIHFDGVLGKTYTKEANSKIVMYSTNFANFTEWRQDGTLAVDVSSISKLAQQYHALGKKVRLWGAPDNATTWKTLMKVGVDYINTDHIEAMQAFLGHESNNANPKH